MNDIYVFVLFHYKLINRTEQNRTDQNRTEQNKCLLAYIAHSPNTNTAWKRREKKRKEEKTYSQ